jgi:hypothetical protein
MLTVHIWLTYVWLKCMIIKIKNLHVSWQFYYELIMHQATPMVVLGGAKFDGCCAKGWIFW